ncbi:MAG: isopentenyl-diphosphate delta-isomerase, partial [Bacteroidota bacterium]
PQAEDPTAASRKHDHIELAFRSQVLSGEMDQRFHYEPLLAPHPNDNERTAFQFLGKTLRAPLWVSSMTGGTELALKINQNLAKACAEFGMGMGLGSCRSLLYSQDRLDDFNVRPFMGSELPLYGNLGVAQVEELIQKGELGRITDLMNLLKLDGLIIHVNPFQEWMQPEGDRFERPPLETIQEVLATFPTLAVIVKEVGQGMGPASLRALFALPLAAIDTAASGGTNFSKLELLRNDPIKQESFMPLAAVGHTAEDMVNFTNEILADPGAEINCRQLIISGGVRNFLDGYYLTEKVAVPAIYGQASALLRHARGDYELLRTFIQTQLRGLALAKAYLTVKA